MCSGEVRNGDLGAALNTLAPMTTKLIIDAGLGLAFWTSKQVRHGVQFIVRAIILCQTARSDRSALSYNLAMKIVLQRVSSASVTVDEKIVGQIKHGLLALVGIGQHDTPADVEKMAEKIAKLRIFNDDDGKMNLSVADIQGAVLAVSQFTLLADCRRGRRPAFTDAAEPTIAKSLYEHFCDVLRKQDLEVQTGIFAADMKVALLNDGPVTIVLDG